MHLGSSRATAEVGNWLLRLENTVFVQL
jgi:hypothetical protein